MATLAHAGSGIVRFGEESWSELKKVSWPTAQTVVRLTIIVLVISAIVGAYIFVFDNVFTTLITKQIINAQSTPAPQQLP